MRRMEVYNEFVRKRAAVLFATDIAARGLGKKSQEKIFCDHGKYNSLINGWILGTQIIGLSFLIREKQVD